jgi:hypothetical protein
MTCRNASPVRSVASSSGETARARLRSTNRERRERYRRAAQERAPTLLVLGGSLAESQSDRSVLGDLLGQAGVYAGEVGQALGREDAAFAAERRELVDDDEAGPGS